MQRPIPEASFHIVLIGLVGYFLMESFSIRGSAAGVSLTPAFFPKVICILLIALLSLSLIKIVVKGIPKVKTKASNDSLLMPMLAWVLVLSLLVLYALLLESLGYVITTSLLVFCMVSILVLLNKSERDITVKSVGGLAAFSVIVSLFIFILFSKGFGIILPTIGIAGV